MVLGNKFFKSLRFRFLATLIMIGITASAATTLVMIYNFENRTVSVRTEGIIRECKKLSTQMAALDYVENADSDIINSKLETLSSVYGRVTVIDPDFKIVKDTYGIAEGCIDITPQVLKCFDQNLTISNYDRDFNFELVTYPVRNQSSGEILGVMAISVPSDDIAKNLIILKTRGVLMFIVISLICVVAGWFLSKKMIRPLLSVTKGIEDITDGFRTELLNVNDCTETEQVTAAFNTMLSRMRTMDESRQEFVSNVSHELKTPLTSMKVLADSLLMQPEVPNELYHEFMTDISSEIDRETNIINDLLTMVKMDKKNTELQVEDVVIGKMLREVIERLNPIADRKNILLSLDIHKEITAEIDEVKLSLAVTNLIENGIKYNVDGGWVKVSLNADTKYFYITVADSGIGISDEDKDKIFDRFYRADKSHSTQIEGTGLGLSITKTAIILHKGAIKVNSIPGEGTNFQVRIPLKYHYKEEVRRRREKK
ncbi:MAG: sensor histidine kinase [Lachnospiraceae bacterium]